MTLTEQMTQLAKQAKAGAQAGLSAAMLDRLKLDDKRIVAMARVKGQFLIFIHEAAAIPRAWRANCESSIRGQCIR